jgi:hypothetical protein
MRPSGIVRLITKRENLPAPELEVIIFSFLKLEKESVVQIMIAMMRFNNSQKKRPRSRR